MWSITIVGDSMSKKLSKEKGDKMSALSATVGGISVGIPLATVRRAWLLLSSRALTEF